ncbi:hypothetical protein JXA88_12940, partial [Candidatus Fermentibacteria bacterium]|nr:hypothetical protein [Candidatus Fermentibacteria bacterium]
MLLKALVSGLVLLGAAQMPSLFAPQPSDEVISVQAHDPSRTEKTAMEPYPPEAAGYPSTLMRTKEFRQRFRVAKS